MSGHVEFETPDEVAEFDRSLSVWKGTAVDAVLQYECDDFMPVPMDIHTASSIGFVNVVQRYVKSKENIDAVNKGGWTPLMYASYIGHDLVVMELLKAGACVNTKNYKGQTPLSLAASCGNCRVLELLLQEGAEIDSRDRKGWTALFHATFSGHHNIVKLLLDNGADIDAVEPQLGMTPLMEAAAAGHEIIVQHFLQHMVNVFARSRHGETAVSLAKLNNHPKITALLNRYIVKPSAAQRGSQVQSQKAVRKSNVPADMQNTQERAKTKDISISEGPEEFARLMHEARQRQQQSKNVTVGAQDVQAKSERAAIPDKVPPPSTSADVTSAFQPLDDDDDCVGGGFSQTGALTIKSSSGSSGGLIAALGLQSLEDETSLDEPSNSSNGTVQLPAQPGDPKVVPSQDVCNTLLPTDFVNPLLHAAAANNNSCPWSDLSMLLTELGLAKYVTVFQEQDVDLEMFLTLNDNDLKEIGITLFGPRRKMTTAIARWQNESHGSLEQAYAACWEQLNQVTGELDKARNQLLQERQFRAVAETYLVEDQAVWQHVAATVVDASQHCAHMRDVLVAFSGQCEVLTSRLASGQDGTDRVVSKVPTSSPARGEDSPAAVVARLLYLKDDLVRTVTRIASALEKLTKRPVLDTQSQTQH